jgi:alkaline phosphatase
MPFGLVAARGPGSANVKDVMSNVDLFGIMREAFGWR